MEKLVDIESGSMLIDESIVLHDRLKLREALDAGIVFEREVDVRTGWVYRGTGLHTLRGRKAMLLLGFQRDELRNISFSLVVNSEVSSTNLLELHRQFLLAELGPPEIAAAGAVHYQFPWGDIDSSIDIRSGGCDILLSWN